MSDEIKETAEVSEPTQEAEVKTTEVQENKQNDYNTIERKLQGISDQISAEFAAAIPDIVNNIMNLLAKGTAKPEPKPQKTEDDD